MSQITLERIKDTNINKYPSSIIKDYYEIIQKLISIIIMMDCLKADGDGAHKQQIDYLKANYKEISESKSQFINELRLLRNKISYDGFFITKDYVQRKEIKILEIINTLKQIINYKF